MREGACAHSPLRLMLAPFSHLSACHSRQVCLTYPSLPQPCSPAWFSGPWSSLSRRVRARVWAQGNTKGPPTVGIAHFTYQWAAGSCSGCLLFFPHLPFTQSRLARATDTLCLPDPAESIPTILDSFYSQEVWAGHTVELPCTASGYPIPAIRWLKDGRPLPADNRWTNSITGLTISDLRTEDSGTYICEVTNTFGSAEATGTLTVIGEWGKLFFQPHP